MIKGLEGVGRYAVQRQRLSDDLQIMAKRLDSERRLILEPLNQRLQIRKWIATLGNKNERVNHRNREAPAKLKVLKKLNVELGRV